MPPRKQRSSGESAPVSSRRPSNALLGLALAVLFGCGGPGPQPTATSKTQPASGAADAGPTHRQPSDPVSSAVEGAAECDALVARVVRCEGFGDEEKREFQRSAEIWRQEAAADRESRDAANQDCREMARTMEGSLVRLGC